ncbi:hypothetical protein, partial [Oleiphilus sp. HI0128]
MIRILILFTALIVCSAAKAEMSGFAPLDFLPDVDRNGIRDDIDKQIIDLYENDKRRIHLASRAAKLIQEIAQNEDSP